MPQTANFTITQGSDPTSFTLTDTTTSPDPALTGRKIYLTKDDGTTIVPSGTSTDYINWPLSDGATKVLTGILERDWSLNAIVQWFSSAPDPGGTYTKAILRTFTGNLEAFYYSLSQLQSSNPALMNDNNYFYNKLKLRVFINDATNATTYSDQLTAQQSLNSAYDLQQNQNTYF